MDVNKKRTPCVVFTGKRKVKDMLIYFAPLINELCNLWNGVQVVDNSTKGRRKIFIVWAILMWTMHDYPKYNDVSKCSVRIPCMSFMWSIIIGLLKSAS